MTLLCQLSPNWKTLFGSLFCEGILVSLSIGWPMVNVWENTSLFTGHLTFKDAGVKCLSLHNSQWPAHFCHTCPLRVCYSVVTLNDYYPLTTVHSSLLPLPSPQLFPFPFSAQLLSLGRKSSFGMRLTKAAVSGQHGMLCNFPPGHPPFFHYCATATDSPMPIFSYHINF